MDLNQFSTVDIVLDKANDNIIQRQTISAGDRDGRSLTLQVTNEGSIGEVPGLTANLLWTNHSSGVSDLSAFSVVDRTTSVFKIEYPQNMLTAGKVTAQIQLLHNGKVTHSKKFEIIVLDVAGSLKGVLQTAEYTALVEALAKTNGFDGNIRNLELKKADASALAPINYDISELRGKKVDKGGNEQVTLAMLSQEVKESIAGGSVAVVGKDAVNTSNIVEGAVTLKHLAGISDAGENLINPYKTTKNQYIDATTGKITSGESGTGLNIISDFIAVLDKKHLNVTNQCRHNITFYTNDNQNSFMAGQSASTSNDRRIVEIPDNAKYFRVTYRSVEADSVMVSFGKVYKNYEKYKFNYENLASNDDVISKSEITFRELSINGETGVEILSENRLTSDALKLMPGTKVSFLNDGGFYRLAVSKYDMNGTFIGNEVDYSESKNEFFVSEVGFYRIIIGYHDGRNLSVDDSIIDNLSIDKNKNEHFEKMLLSSAGKLDYSRFHHGTVFNYAPQSSSYTIKRIALKKILLIPGQKLAVEQGVKMQIMHYDFDGEYIDTVVLLNSNISDYVIGKSGLYTIILALAGDVNIDDVEELATKLTLSNIDIDNQYKQYDYVPANFYKKVTLSEINGNFSSHCFVNDEFWCFTASDYNPAIVDGNVYRYSYDDDLNFTFLGKFKHNWNHVNCVGYSAVNDTIVCSSFNGNSTPTDQERYEVYLIKNISTLKNLSEILIQDHATRIAMPQEWGWRMGVTFGESNLGQEDIIYYITNDNSDIRKLQLGKDDVNLGEGNFVSGQTGFNGSYKVIKEYHDENSSFEVNQGASFYDGKLYLGLGHEGIYFQKTDLKRDGTIDKTSYRDKFYDASGAEMFVTGGFSDITVNKDFVICGLQSNLLFIYQK